METIQEITSSIKARIDLALDEIRPFLHADGGDIELIEIQDDLTIILAFKGACKSCQMSEMTFANGVEEAIRRHVPEIKRVLVRKES